MSSDYLRGPGPRPRRGGGSRDRGRLDRRPRVLLQDPRLPCAARLRTRARGHGLLRERLPDARPPRPRRRAGAPCFAPAPGPPSRRTRLRAGRSRRRPSPVARRFGKARERRVRRRSGAEPARGARRPAARPRADGAAGPPPRAGGRLPVLGGQAQAQGRPRRPDGGRDRGLAGRRRRSHTSGGDPSARLPRRLRRRDLRSLPRALPRPRPPDRVLVHPSRRRRSGTALRAPPPSGFPGPGRALPKRDDRPDALLAALFEPGDSREARAPPPPLSSKVVPFLPPG